MARIRTIKPEFWTSEQVMELSLVARLAFVGMWNFCDDGGVHPASPKTLKAEVFPSDDITSAEIAAAVQEMIEQGLVIEYVGADDGRAYWAVTGWYHQKVDQPTRKYPGPNGEQPASIRRPNRQHSPNVHRTFAERSPLEGKGREVNLKPSPRHTLPTTQTPPYPPTAESERAQAPPDSVPIPTEPTAPAVPSPAATAVLAMRSAGIADGNPGHPKLRALLAAGVTADDLASAAATAAESGKGFAYALGVAEGRHRDAAALSAQHLAQPPPGVPINGKRQTLSEQRRAASLALTGRRTDEPPPERDITAESARLA